MIGGILIVNMMTYIVFVSIASFFFHNAFCTVYTKV